MTTITAIVINEIVPRTSTQQQQVFGTFTVTSGIKRRVVTYTK